MAEFERDGVRLHYEEFGEGYPLFLIAPGGMRSTVSFWHRSPFDPTNELAGSFRVIAMDQRNAGASSGPISANDGWQTYAADQLALLDHLGIERCHIMGGCIGCSYCLGLIKAAPQRISAAVLQNPIGLSENNRDDFHNMFNEWAKELESAGRASGDALRSFGDNMFDGEFVFSVDRDFVRASQTPLLILAGADNFHPTATAQEIAALAPRAKLLLKWGSAEEIPSTVQRVRSFLQEHEPAATGAR